MCNFKDRGQIVESHMEKLTLSPSTTVSFSNVIPDIRNKHVTHKLTLKEHIHIYTLEIPSIIEYFS